MLFFCIILACLWLILILIKTVFPAYLRRTIRKCRRVAKAARVFGYEEFALEFEQLEKSALATLEQCRVWVWRSHWKDVQ